MPRQNAGKSATGQKNYYKFDNAETSRTATTGGAYDTPVCSNKNRPWTETPCTPLCLHTMFDSHHCQVCSPNVSPCNRVSAQQPEKVPCVTVYISRPPGPIFHARYLHSSWDSATDVPPNRSALETSRRELSEDVSFGIGTGTLVVVERPRAWKTAPEGRDRDRRIRSCHAHARAVWAGSDTNCAFSL